MLIGPIWDKVCRKYFDVTRPNSENKHSKFNWEKADMQIDSSYSKDLLKETTKCPISVYLCIFPQRVSFYPLGLFSLPLLLLFSLVLHIDSVPVHTPVRLNHLLSRSGLSMKEDVFES